MSTKTEIVLSSGENCGGALNLVGITKRFNEIKRASYLNWTDVTEADILCTDLIRTGARVADFLEVRLRPVMRHDPALVQAVKEVGGDTDFYVTAIESDRYRIFRDGGEEYVVTPESLTEDGEWITIHNWNKGPRMIAVSNKMGYLDLRSSWWSVNLTEELCKLKGIDYDPSFSFYYESFCDTDSSDPDILYPHDQELIQLLMDYPLPGWRLECVYSKEFPLRYTIIEGEVLTPDYSGNWIWV